MQRLIYLLGALLWLFGSALHAEDTSAKSDHSGEYNVRDFGAIGDGNSLDSPAINRAILAASAAGGGTVILPAGTYLSVSIRLKSNIHLHLQQGAVLLAADRTDANPYDSREANPHTQYQDSGHSHWQNSFLWGDGLENITIDGPGEIYGKGLLSDWVKEDGYGDKAIALKWCRNVTLRDFTIRHGGWFGILATGVDHLTIDNLTIDTNRDGMDIDCCRNVRISNCSINSPTDDGICLKSSYGLGEARATENVTISNCLVSGYDEGSLLDGTRKWSREKSPTGRIKFGTESNGGFKNITITNCVFDKCRGFALETVDGGLLEDVAISNITMRDIVNAPIFLRLARRMRGPEGTPVGKLRRVNISHVVIYNADSAITIAAVPEHPIEDISLSHIQIWTKGGGATEQGAIIPPESEKDYPEPGSLGTMPASGLYLRHVAGVALDQLQFHTLADDARPTIVLDDVAGADLFRLKSQRTGEAKLIQIRKATDFSIRSTNGVPDTELSAAENRDF